MAAGDKALLESGDVDHILLDTDVSDVLLWEEEGAGPTFQPAWAARSNKLYGAGFN